LRACCLTRDSRGAIIPGGEGGEAAAAGARQPGVGEANHPSPAGDLISSKCQYYSALVRITVQKLASIFFCSSQ